MRQNGLQIHRPFKQMPTTIDLCTKIVSKVKSRTLETPCTREVMLLFCWGGAKPELWLIWYRWVSQGLVLRAEMLVPMRLRWSRMISPPWLPSRQKTASFVCLAAATFFAHKQNARCKRLKTAHTKTHPWVEVETSRKEGWCSGREVTGDSFPALFARSSPCALQALLRFHFLAMFCSSNYFAFSFDSLKAAFLWSFITTKNASVSVLLLAV